MLSPGRHICPRCGGGRDKERSLSVGTKEGAMVWLCHRASCGYKGRGSTAKVETRLAPVKQKHITYITGYNKQPIYDNDGDCRGYVFRASHKGVVPKTINDLEEGWALHFPKRIKREAPVLLVEDRASAQKMSPYFPTVALLGTTITQEKINYLLKCGAKYGIIALDEDASAKAIALKRRWSFIQRVVLLERDIKDEKLHTLLTLARKLS